MLPSHQLFTCTLLIVIIKSEAFLVMKLLKPYEMRNKYYITRSNETSCHIQ